ncbi:hypothetical protein C1646_760244 [Rhizophagus diaphanus]|nr:hypothetical protein C1646_760244 [Rhizophagus diaphanus] [Rhizophagus sp. MUCL 43196]
MATCICKQILACVSIPVVFNNTSVHNPKNIDASNIYNDTFDQIELLTVHCYNNAIAKYKKEHLMKEVCLIRLQENNLHSINDYIKALKMILDIDKDTE